jgi:hypothetical protein
VPGQDPLPAAAPAPHHQRLLAAVPLAQRLPAAVPLAQRLQLQLVLAPLPEAQALEQLEAALRLGFVRLALQPQQPPPQSLLQLPQRSEN